MDEHFFAERKYGFFRGMMWGMAFTIPLWLSIFGWIKVLRGLM